MNNRLTIKETLLATINQQKTPYQIRSGSPITDVKIKAQAKETIEELTQSLEALNPNLYPLLYSPNLLDGVWQLQYATAGEIRRLSSLKYGLRVGPIYQVIDLQSKSFFNQAFVEHRLGLISGYVLVTAIFEPAKDGFSPLPNDTLNINFKTRYLAITNIAQINTPNLDPLKEVPANNPKQRVPMFKITYLDEDLRIGRGGDGGLYILSKSPDTTAIQGYYRFIQSAT
ncbi:PAP/fibrillin family protein [Crocosphaera sp. XPORK-15E]|uniref:PAP/fibrillin family protein n=1 Tax=Crocosphaera sp. XPORK-15E TaxID=3110247 RepID=UPI002B20BDC5|nr:PAP/fibrillin family protein [Crocosphaera sp. XPORK-15E]MEA5532764.1 PAP/fibrillin family protein [Crocosphaera sp. XPORK-15E]